MTEARKDSPLLFAEDLTISFGGLAAVDSVDFCIEKGETVGLIGPNGSGKTTFFNIVTGIYHPDRGKILFEGFDIAGEKPYQIARRGIARTFQNGRLFLDISALDNVVIGMHARQKADLLDIIFRYKRAKSELQEGAKIAMELLAFFSEELRDNCLKTVADLPHTDRKRVEICRALASNPRLLLLDEPAGGMSPEETEELMQDIGKIKEKNREITIIVIEHDMSVIERIADRVYVFNYGKKIAEGLYSRVSKDQKVIEAYLGEEIDDVET
jgi:branched-chain amino acid transport system ATP-binding protein/sulfate-transporting ATPase